MYAFSHACMHVRTYVCMYVVRNAYTYTHKYRLQPTSHGRSHGIHTYTHTHIQASTHELWPIPWHTYIHTHTGFNTRVMADSILLSLRIVCCHHVQVCVYACVCISTFLSCSGHVQVCMYACMRAVMCRYVCMCACFCSFSSDCLLPSCPGVCICMCVNFYFLVICRVCMYAYICSAIVQVCMHVCTHQTSMHVCNCALHRTFSTRCVYTHVCVNFYFLVMCRYLYMHTFVLLARIVCCIMYRCTYVYMCFCIHVLVMC